MLDIQHLVHPRRAARRPLIGFLVGVIACTLGVLLLAIAGCGEVTTIDQLDGGGPGGLATGGRVGVGPDAGAAGMGGTGGAAGSAPVDAGGPCAVKIVWSFPAGATCGSTSIGARSVTAITRSGGYTSPLYTDACPTDDASGEFDVTVPTQAPYYFELATDSGATGQVQVGCSGGVPQVGQVTLGAS